MQLLGFVKMCVFPEGGISGLGSSVWACYVEEFHPKCSKFGTIVHLGSKTEDIFLSFFFFKGPIF